MKNYAFLKDNMEDISLEYFTMVANVCMSADVTTIAPLGFSGDDFILFGKFIEASESEDGKWHRESLVQLRNYSGTLELLVTDKKGNFLVHSTYNGMPFNIAIELLYQSFLNVKDLVNTTTEPTFKNINVAKNANVSEGFKILETYLLKLKEEKVTS